MRFPHGRCSGSRVPDWALKTGHSFRNAALAESASQNQPPERDVVFRWALFRKLCPGISLQSGTQFPDSHRTGNCSPEFTFRVGHAFRLNLDWETSSYSQ